MKPETRTVAELFERDVRYVVPLYQRPYVWNEGDQWEPLWEDIRVLVDHQLNGSPGPEGHWSHTRTASCFLASSALGNARAQDRRVRARLIGAWTHASDVKGDVVEPDRAVARTNERRARR